MAYSPSEKYPGAVDVDPDYQGGKFRDNNPSTTNNGSPLKAIDRNELLARDEAIMNDAGFEYSGVADTPQDSQLFKAYKASLGNGANLLSNHNFINQHQNHTQPAPSSTPTSYPPGYQIFSGVFANETSGITNLTYIDGRVSFSGGDLYFAVPNAGAIARLTAAQLTASVADFDGKPRTRGVSFALAGDEYRVTVGVDALEDAATNPTPIGSVKFEQGSVATRHAVQTAKGQTYTFNTVAEMVANGAPVGSKVNWLGYYKASDGGSNWGIVKKGAHIDNGGSIFSIDVNTYIEANIVGAVNVKKFGLVPDWDGAAGTDNTPRMDKLLSFTKHVRFPSGRFAFKTTVFLSPDWQGLSIKGISDFRTSTGRENNTEIVSASAGGSPVFNVSGAGTLTDFSLGGFAFTQTGTGGALFESSSSISFGEIDNISYTLNNQNVGFINMSVVSWTNSKINNIYGTGAIDQSVPQIAIDVNDPGSTFSCEYKNWFLDNRGSPTAPMVLVRDLTSGSTSGASTFANIVIEHGTHGGGLHLYSLKHLILDTVFVDDSYMFTAPAILIGKSAAGQSPNYNKLSGCIAKEGGGAAFPDIKIEGTGGNIVDMIGCDFDDVDVNAASFNQMGGIIGSNHGISPLVMRSNTLSKEDGKFVFFGEEGEVTIPANSSVSISFQKTYAESPSVLCSHKRHSLADGPCFAGSASTTNATLVNEASTDTTVKWIALNP